MSEIWKRWIRALAVALIIFIVLSLYLYLRRGYYNIYIINKVLGSGAVVLAGIALFIGPLRKISFIAFLMTIRRQLGLLAFGFALLHVTASLYQSQRFEWFSWYIEEWIPVSFGILAILIWGYMTYISRNTKIVQMGSDVWKRRLSLAGDVAFLAIFFHLVVMKYQGWIKWFSGDVKQSAELANPSYPPASIFVLIIMLVVIVFRLVYGFRKRTGKIK